MLAVALIAGPTHIIILFPVFWVAGLALSIPSGFAAYRGEWHEIPAFGKIAKQQLGMAS